MTTLVRNTAFAAHTPTLNQEPIPGEQIIKGNPHTGSLTLGTLDGTEVGLWEMTPGVATDIEVEEFFVVLSGSATVEFRDGSPTLHLRPGDVVRLGDGAETIWTVTETLRKVYLT